MSIDLDPIASGYNLSKINSNFQKVENELNNNTLRRDGLAIGENNSMEVDLDMNSNTILNAKVNGVDLDDIIDQLLGLIDLAEDLENILNQIVNGGGFNIGTYIPSIATLKLTEPVTNKQLVFVLSYYTGGIVGGGYFLYDNTDVSTPDDEGFTTTVTAGGKRWKRIIDGDLNAEWSGVDLTGATNGTAKLQMMLNTAAARFKLYNNTAIKQKIIINGNIRINSNITMDGAKVALKGPGSFFLDPAGTYSGPAITVTNTSSVTLSSYSNKTVPILEDLQFLSTGRTIDLILGVNTTGDSNNNPAALHNVYNCQFSGFNRIFTNGVGGWGWVWVGSGSRDTNRWLFITNQADTYERFSFTNCIWQNAGYAFELDNPNGKIYWDAGSFDYCEGAAKITRGSLEINSHIEYSNRTLPFIQLLGNNAFCKITGGHLAIRQNSVTTYNLIEQFADYQAIIDGLVVNSDGINVSSCVMSNKPYWKNNLQCINDAAKVTMLFDTDGALVAPGLSSIDRVITGTGITEVVNGDGSVTYTSSVAAGGSKGVDFFIPIVGHTQIGIAWFASNTSAVGSVFLSKLITTQASRASAGLASTVGRIIDFSANGTTTIVPGASNVRGSSGTLWTTPKSAFYLRVRYNMDNIGIGDTFTVHSFKLISC